MPDGARDDRWSCADQHGVPIEYQFGKSWILARRRPRSVVSRSTARRTFSSLVRKSPRLPPTATLGSSFSVISSTASTVQAALLVRRTSTTHVVDGDQRAVYLPITGVSGSKITMAMAVESGGRRARRISPCFLRSRTAMAAQIPSVLRADPGVEFVSISMRKIFSSVIVAALCLVATPAACARGASLES